jgi:aryl-alcohol dehydrogenase-like predicted oxidoreductase
MTFVGEQTFLVEERNRANMRMKRLGNTGLRVSEICLGTMTFGNQADQATAFEIMDTAEQGGVNFFDTADAYPGAGTGITGTTEEMIGNWLHERGARERIVLVTKVFAKVGPNINDQGLSRKHILAACEASLKRLQTDYLDLYQVHQFDAETPMEETLGALDDLVRAGKVRYIGCSNFQAWRLADALGISRLKGLESFVSVQPRYNMLFRMIEEELLPLCDEHGVGVIVYNPLAAGMLTGRYVEKQEANTGTRFQSQNPHDLYRRRYWNDAVFAEVAHLATFMKSRQRNLTHVALAWVLSHPTVTSAIVGASRPEQLKESLQGAELQLDEEEMHVCNDIWYNLPRLRDADIARR